MNLFVTFTRGAEGKTSISKLDGLLFQLPIALLYPVLGVSQYVVRRWSEIQLGSCAGFMIEYVFHPVFHLFQLRSVAINFLIFPFRACWSLFAFRIEDIMFLAATR